MIDHPDTVPSNPNRTRAHEIEDLALRLFEKTFHGDETTAKALARAAFTAAEAFVEMRNQRAGGAR